MADYQGNLFNPKADAAAAQTGYYRDRNGQWWLITKRVQNPTEGSELWVFSYALVVPGNIYGFSVGKSMGTSVDPASAVESIDTFAYRWKLEHADKGTPLWFWLLVGYALYKRRRR